MIRKNQASMGHFRHLRVGLALVSMLSLTAPAVTEDGKSTDVLETVEITLPALPDINLPDIESAVARDLASVARPDEAAVPAPPPEQNAAALITEPEPKLSATETSEISLDLPAPPDIVVALEPMETPVPASASVAAAPIEIPRPELPVVIVSIEAPAPAPIKPAEASGADARPLDAALLRAHLEGERSRLKLRPGIIDAILAAYAEQGAKPGWMHADGMLSPAVSALRDTLARADLDGLDPARLLSVLPTMLAGKVEAADREKVDAALSLAAFLYAHDARGGRLDPVRLSSMLTPNLTLPSPTEFLPRAWGAAPEKIADVLGAYQPTHPGYRALRTRLAALRAGLAEPVTTSSIPGSADNALKSLPQNFMAGGQLVPGRSDPRVPALRIRLNLPAQEDALYDAPLVDAVKAFQRASGLTPNGRITPKTREALEDFSSPLTLAERRNNPQEMIAGILANMERWRWLPPELGKTHIVVNVPEYRLDMISGGASIFHTRVIVGKPDTQTPIFSDAMDFLVVNPSWHVPPSILKNEFIPRLQQDPEYAAKRGYEVVRRGNSISVRQPPGDRNALGHVKFMFPNQHAVYLHDTPSRHLFSSATRAFSHGCVRVEGPFRLAEQILLAKQGFTEKSLRAMVGNGERTIRLTEKIPVHLTYFTLSTDANGALVRHPDIYGHDTRIRKALAL